jgi:hypothetical protein
MKLVVLGALVASFGCEPRVPEPFIALERDFQAFERWQKVDLSRRPSIGVTHAAGDAHEYISQMPPPGARTFPVGTILVKTVKSDGKKTTGDGTDVFAMVKRGAGYNARGSAGWEWFELRRRDDHSLGIVWRGVNPPSGEGYGGDPVGGCNACHQTASKNDYVQAPALTLSRL